jgi:hypothetical protein
MHVTACTSFSIVTSTEGMPIAATEIEFLRVTNTPGVCQATLRFAASACAALGANSAARRLGSKRASRLTISSRIPLGIPRADGTPLRSLFAAK